MILIQARSTSTRFPGKAMALLNGHPLIRHVYDRCGVVHGPRAFVIPDGDPIRVYLRENHIQFYEGSERDVLARYYHAAKSMDLQWVMRVTGDCPLISLGQIAIVYQMGLSTKADFVTNCLLESSDGHEVEYISIRLLEKCFKEAQDDADREHVTTWIKRNWQRLVDEKFVLGSYIEPMALSPKMSVDTPEDLEEIKIISDLIAQRKNLYVQLGQKNGSNGTGKAGLLPRRTDQPKGKRARAKA
jgi:spore coat polysaccharide biosynthesis protein SpsF (cytidylyltransferase family)